MFDRSGLFASTPLGKSISNAGRGAERQIFTVNCAKTAMTFFSDI
jgi:hypothetical protein